MKRYLFSGLLALLTLAFLGQLDAFAQTTSASVLANRPFPQHVTYSPGSIRPSNFSQAEQDNHVRHFYDYWKNNYLVYEGTNATGKPLYRVAFGVGSDITVSEGQGYGMVIVALMAGHEPDAQTLFDGLWYFSREYPSGIDPRLMSWKVQNGNVVDGNDSAFDGDVDIAYSLLLADAQWGSNGDVNYQAEAIQVIDGILASTIGPSSRLPMLGDWVNPNGSPHNQYTPRSSDIMPAHFRAFGHATNDPVWDEVIANSQAV
jgi:endo-1,4-beta-D-glucanase Y